MITQEQKQSLVDSLISEWENMTASFTREDLTLEDDIAGIDVRIQVSSDKGLLDWSDIQIHTGDAQYDTNHHGYWGAGFLDYDFEEEILETLITELVNDLISQVERDHATNKKPFNLSDVVEKKNKLSREQKRAFVKVFGKRCKTERQVNLMIAIHDVETLDNFDNWSIYQQVIFTEETPYCAYFAGQDYTKGVKTIREAFTKGY